ncbi:MAG: ABC-2 transporter permease [Clostridiales bacterium]|nr:ABC-2 transporter permease [Clostridiales bacterium]
MKGLLLKDSFVVRKTLLTYLVFAIATAIVLEEMTFLWIVWGSLLSITTVAYDEQCKWNVLEKMMPYSTKDIVLSKYVFSYISVGVLSLAVLMVTIFSNIIKGTQTGSGYYYTILIVALIGLAFISIILPLMLILGAEKGKIAAMIFIGFVSALSVFISDNIKNIINNIMSEPMQACIIAIVVVAVMNIISIILSIKFYELKKKKS